MCSNNYQAPYFASYPTTRLRRNRNHKWLRDIIQENHLTVNDLIYPVFVMDGTKIKEPIATMPGIFRYSIDYLLDHLTEVVNLGIKAIAIFPHIDNSFKDEKATEAINENNLINRAIKKIKDIFPDLGIICDVALDPYLSHSHDGIVRNGVIENDITNEILARQAVLQAKAGCDIVAPSDMMDGRVGVIRKSLDAAGYENVGILSYAVKYASKLYDPFRDAVGSKQKQAIDKATYQMHYANSHEVLSEISLDISEGCDMVMVKPGGMYLDVVKLAVSNFDIPVFAYHVSGEYAMLKFAAMQNAINYEDVLIEALYCFKRAGVRAILTYGAVDAAKIILDN
ncbi:MAG: porphobilinogen synthase [Pseudomonadota bacterium]